MHVRQYIKTQNTTMQMNTKQYKTLECATTNAILYSMICTVVHYIKI